MLPFLLFPLFFVHDNYEKEKRLLFESTLAEINKPYISYINRCAEAEVKAEIYKRLCIKKVKPTTTAIKREAKLMKAEMLGEKGRTNAVDRMVK